MTCPRGCCATYKEHIASIGFRPTIPANKVTEHHTDTAVVTETEHWADRLDTHVQMLEPPVMKLPKESYDHLASTGQIPLKEPA